MNNNNYNNQTNCVSNINNNKMTSKTRLIRLYRDGSTQLGFSIRGGWEHGTGIFVSEVHPGSEAAKQGLQAGDQIVRINGFSLEHAIHDDVIALVKSSSKITLKVKSVGMIPIKDRLSDVLTWKLLSPSPSPPSLSSSPSPAWTSSDSHSDSEHEYLEANIYIDLQGRSLGCSVVKGPPNYPGIYVQNVKFNEIADQSGLEVGDQIIQVNGVNVCVMDFSEAINKLKSLASMTLTVKKGAGRHLFGMGIGLNHCNNRNNGFNNDINNRINKSVNHYKTDNNCVQKKRVTAIVHHSGSNGNTHSRMLSTSSNGSEQSTTSSGLNEKTNTVSNTNGSDNDYSISEMDNCVVDSDNCVQNINKTIFLNNNNNINNNNVNNYCNNNPTTNLLNESPLKILEKVKQEEERLAEERRRLEEEQHKLKIEMQKLELEKKELERRKQLDECNSLSNCSISSASNSSSGSQSISFLEEIKAMGDHKRLLRPVNSVDNRNNNYINNKSIDNKINETNGKTNISSKLVTPLKNCDNFGDKHKQHELLMEEFRRAHRRMFGDNDTVSDKLKKNSKTETTHTQQSDTKEQIKETKSLPIGNTSVAVPAPVKTPLACVKTPLASIKTPPAVPIKKNSTGPVVQIGTYVNNSLTNNRFVTQNHRSVIQVRREDSTDNSNNVDKNDPQITIKVISTKQ